MGTTYEMVREAALWLQARTKITPEIGVITGTGLGESTGALVVDAVIPYGEIPHFPTSTVKGHAGELVMGHLSGKPVFAMRGRMHLYEGYTPQEVAFPIRVMREMGVKRLVVTNAAGGIGPVFDVGDLMLITDHINLTGENPLVGPNEEALGIRFPDMSGVYDLSLRHLAAEVAASRDLPLKEGVYAGLKGPSLETPAEIRFLGVIGAQAVGMSTVTEVIAAKHAGMDVVGISTITNINDPDRPRIATIEEIVAEAGKASARLERLLVALVGEMV